MKYKIGIWGQYGAPGQKIADGQAVGKPLWKE